MKSEITRLKILLKRLCAEACKRCAVTASKCNVQEGACEIAAIRKEMEKKKD